MVKNNYILIQYAEKYLDIKLVLVTGPQEYVMISSLFYFNLAILSLGEF